MGEIWFSSDLHFSHDREFVWKERGFENVGEMNITLIDNFNSIIHPGDTLYLLGDNWLNCSVEEGIALLRQIRYKDIRFIRGNHDSPTRWEALKEVGTLLGWAEVIKDAKKYYYLSHYPTHTANYDDEWGTAIRNLHGHTHQKLPVSDDFYFNVGVDAWDCRPVSFGEVKTLMNKYYFDDVLIHPKKALEMEKANV
jgi:calcineurin-like phosphoesterase family protein